MPALAPALREALWPTLLRNVVGTAIGGYLVLMAVVVGWYEGITRTPWETASY